MSRERISFHVVGLHFCFILIQYSNGQQLIGENGLHNSIIPKARFPNNQVENKADIYNMYQPSSFGNPGSSFSQTEVINAVDGPHDLSSNPYLESLGANKVEDVFGPSAFQQPLTYPKLDLSPSKHGLSDAEQYFKKHGLNNLNGLSGASLDQIASGYVEVSHNPQEEHARMKKTSHLADSNFLDVLGRGDLQGYATDLTSLNSNLPNIEIQSINNRNIEPLLFSTPRSQGPISTKMTFPVDAIPQEASLNSQTEHQIFNPSSMAGVQIADQVISLPAVSSRKIEKSTGTQNKSFKSATAKKHIPKSTFKSQKDLGKATDKTLQKNASRNSTSKRIAFSVATKQNIIQGEQARNQIKNQKRGGRTTAKPRVPQAPTRARIQNQQKKLRKKSEMKSKSIFGKFSSPERIKPILIKKPMNYPTPILSKRTKGLRRSNNRVFKKYPSFTRLRNNQMPVRSFGKNRHYQSSTTHGPRRRIPHRRKRQATIPQTSNQPGLSAPPLVGVISVNSAALTPSQNGIVPSTVSATTQGLASQAIPQKTALTPASIGQSTTNIQPKSPVPLTTLQTLGAPSVSTVSFGKSTNQQAVPGINTLQKRTTLQQTSPPVVSIANTAQVSAPKSTTSQSFVDPIASQTTVPHLGAQTTGSPLITHLQPSGTQSLGGNGAVGSSTTAAQFPSVPPTTANGLNNVDLIEVLAQVLIDQLSSQGTQSNTTPVQDLLPSSQGTVSTGTDIPAAQANNAQESIIASPTIPVNIDPNRNRHHSSQSFLSSPVSRIDKVQQKPLHDFKDDKRSRPLESQTFSSLSPPTSNSTTILSDTISPALPLLKLFHPVSTYLRDHLPESININSNPSSSTNPHNAPHSDSSRFRVLRSQVGHKTNSRPTIDSQSSTSKGTRTNQSGAKFKTIRRVTDSNVFTLDEGIVATENLHPFLLQNLLVDQGMSTFDGIGLFDNRQPRPKTGSNDPYDALPGNDHNRDNSRLSMMGSDPSRPQSLTIVPFHNPMSLSTRNIRVTQALF